MLIKEITLVFEQFELELESNPDIGSLVLRLTEFVLDEEKTTSECEVYKSNNKLEIYPDYDEIKEIIKSLQQILPEEETGQ